MKITSINITGFGKFKNQAFTFGDGINVICGKNEAGKSTTHTFIKSMLFGMKKKKTKNQIDTYTKYLPMDSDAKYEGTLVFSYGSKNYQIYRKFYENRSSLEIRDVSNGELIENPNLFLSKVLCSLTVDTFDNTISIGQMKSAQDSTLIKDLQRYIANLNTSGNISINTMEAINYLKQKRDVLSSQINNEASLLYHRQLGNIRNVEKELSNKIYENHIPETLAKKEQDKETIENKNKLLKKLKKEIESNNAKLKSFNFKSKDDIEVVNIRAERYYDDYAPLMDSHISGAGIFFNELFIFIGVILVFAGALLLVTVYPDVASLLKLNNLRNALSFLNNFISKLPVKPIIIISILLFLGSICIIGNLLSLVFGIQNIDKADELKNSLSEMFKQYIDTEEITKATMTKFKNQLSYFKNLFDKNESNLELIETTQKEIDELENIQKEYDELISKQEKIQYDVDQKYNELYDLKLESEKYKQELEKNDNINKEIESIDLAIDNLNTVADDIKVAFGTHLNKTASKYIYSLSNGKYDSLSIDDSLNITINYENQMIPLSKVSTGTMDQIYLAMRLATYDLIRGNKEALPILFDECFAMYDNDRLSSTIQFLNDEIKSQIILFTCQTREPAYLEIKHIPFNRINL